MRIYLFTVCISPTPLDQSVFYLGVLSISEATFTNASVKIMRLSSSSAGGFSISSAVTIAAAFFSIVSAAPSSPTPTDDDGPATPVLDLDLMKRDSADDATDPAKVLAWMYDNVDLEPDRAVFYSGNIVGQPMAKAFCDENEEDGYKYFYSIFDQDFSDAFGGADPSADTEIARACSKALAEFVTGEVRVFNDAGGKVFWFFFGHFCCAPLA